MAEAGSESTASTSGFGELDGDKNLFYNLVDLREKSTKERIDALISKTHDTIKYLESKDKKTIQCFCIGKTFVKEVRKDSFNPNDVKTWGLKGIRNRRIQKYKHYDGLVVLGAVSDDMLKTEREEVWDRQLYAVSLEFALISHFAYEECDQRLANESLHPGNVQQELSPGNVVYMAFSYKKSKKSEPRERTEQPQQKDPGAELGQLSISRP